jgi:hypothetical protein
MTGDPRARRYQRLLFCYPRSYRQARGDELVATLLDAAPPLRTRPSLREAGNLIGHGLRCRLGRPTSRSVVVWATLAATICGLFIASLATRLGWQTARTEPSAAEATATITEVLPGIEAPRIEATTGHFHVTKPLGPDNLGELAFGFGGLLNDTPARYERSFLRVVVSASQPIDGDRLLTIAQQRLRDAGWQPSAPTVLSDRCVSGCNSAALDMQRTVLIARRGDTVFALEVDHGGIDADTVMVAMYRATPRSAYLAAVAGFLLGAIAGWLLVGWVSRRTEGSETASGLVSGLFAVAILLWSLSALLGAGSAAIVVHRDPFRPWPPLWEWLGQPEFSGLFLGGSSVTLLAVVIAAAPRRRGRPTAPNTANA